MLEFDSTTLANMTAALDQGCKLLPHELDTTDNRKRIGDAIMGAARSGKRTLVQLSEVAQGEVEAILGPKRSGSRAFMAWLERFR
jgi:hypothetical protein